MNWEQWKRAYEHNCEDYYSAVRKLTTIGGRTKYLLQCLFCGRTTNPLKQHMLITRYGLDALKTAIEREDTARFPASYKQFKLQYPNSERVNYDDYLQSKEWQYRRKAVIQKSRSICYNCGCKLLYGDVHHLKYDNLGFEPLADLVFLCRDCRKKTHKDIDNSAQK